MFLSFHFKDSAESFLREAIPGSTDDSTFNSWDPEFGEKVVRITLLPTASFTFADNVRKGLHAMSFSSFSYDLVDLGTKDGEAELINSIKPTVGCSKLVEAINLLKYSFKQFECRYKSGKKGIILKN